MKQQIFEVKKCLVLLLANEWTNHSVESDLLNELFETVHKTELADKSYNAVKLKKNIVVTSRNLRTNHSVESDLLNQF